MVAASAVLRVAPGHSPSGPRQRGRRRRPRHRSERSPCAVWTSPTWAAPRRARPDPSTLQLAEEIGDRWGLDRVYVNFTDVLTMLGRPRIGRTPGWRASRRSSVRDHAQPSLIRTRSSRCSRSANGTTRTGRVAALRITAELPLHAPHSPRRRRDRARRVRRRARAPRAALATLREDRGLGLYDPAAQSSLCGSGGGRTPIRPSADGLAMRPPVRGLPASAF